MTAPLSPNRRAFLMRTVASALVISPIPLLASGCSALRLNSGDAFNVWYDLPEAGSDNPLDWIHAAILAPSAHNTQPWLFVIHSREHLEIRPDLSRTLGALDPSSRELYISLGCAMENLVIAAARGGYKADVEIQTNPPALHARFQPANVLSDLYPFIACRHTHRSAYQRDKSVDLKLFEPYMTADANGPVLQVVNRGDGYEQVAARIVDATRTMIGDEEVMAASERWMRLTDEQVERYRDGPTLETTGLPPWIIRVAKLLPAPSADTSRAKWLEMTSETQLSTASVFGYFTAANPRHMTTLVEVGRRWQRLHLALTQAGIAAQPINQIPERIDREFALGGDSSTLKEFQQQFGGGKFPLFGFRAGYAQGAALLSPRRPLRDVVERA